MSADSVWLRLRTLVLDRHDRRAQVTAALGLSFVRVKALRMVADQPLTLRTLAERLATDPPYVTVMVADLVARGLVTREPHPADRRARLVTITPAGSAAAAEADRILGTAPASLRDLGAADLATLDRIVTRLLDHPS
jgi:DNA-binding MarR family transcriptional regulator